MDIYIVVDSTEHPAFRRPGMVSLAVDGSASDDLGAIRTITVLDKTTGLTSSARNDDVVN